MLAEGARRLRDLAGSRSARLARDLYHDLGHPPRARYFEAIEELCNGRPLAYVAGLAHFYGLKLTVDERVLIPRPETEELVRWILEYESSVAPRTFADWCTGSGAVAIALLEQRSSYRGLAFDTSEDALFVARNNAERYQVLDRLHLVRADALSQNPQDEMLEAVDFIVSNPPYIPEDDWHRVAPEVADHEPRIALAVEGDDPLLFYRKIALLARQGALRLGGRLYFESNDRYHAELRALLERMGFQALETLVDMQGAPRHVRAVMADL